MFVTTSILEMLVFLTVLKVVILCKTIDVGCVILFAIPLQLVSAKELQGPYRNRFEIIQLSEKFP